MKRNLKTLALALLATLALTAVVASAAPAATYTASSYPTTNTGESPLGNDIFTTEAGVVECKSDFQSTASAATSTMTVTPTYTNCSAFGFLSATVSMGSCDYFFKEPTGAEDNWSAGVQLKCANPESPITITGGTCKATVSAQTPSGSSTITNNTAAGHISVQANVTGIAYTVVADGFGCSFAGTGARTGSTYVQQNPMTFEATNGATIDVG